ncbi:ComF family protein [Granulicatella seriolae]|uniref:Phosphoribosyltransferase family protein n=1 Tax=Granulicatella seriolae TaxID=2967226 RepID=A0ABT1WPC4_9LACT|nr:phosphoribosyltransferase family protein [Granulicatella seriolae]
MREKSCIWCQKNEPTDSVFQLLFKPHPHPSYVCQSCQNIFQPIEPDKACRGCGRSQEGQDYCYDCVRWRRNEKECLANQAIFVYDQAAREWINRYKFEGDCRLSFLVQAALKRSLKPYVKDKTYIICPIPPSKKSLYKRGFDAVAHPLKQINCRYTELLVSLSNGKKQSDKSRQERMLLQGAFALKEEEAHMIDKKVLLIDDVYTTGATLHCAYDLLKDSGFSEVKSLTLFR